MYNYFITNKIPKLLTLLFNFFFNKLFNCSFYFVNFCIWKNQAAYKKKFGIKSIFLIQQKRRFENVVKFNLLSQVKR